MEPPPLPSAICKSADPQKSSLPTGWSAGPGKLADGPSEGLKGGNAADEVLIFNQKILYQQNEKIIDLLDSIDAGLRSDKAAKNSDSWQTLVFRQNSGLPMDMVSGQTTDPSKHHASDQNSGLTENLASSQIIDFAKSVPSRQTTDLAKNLLSNQIIDFAKSLSSNQNTDLAKSLPSNQTTDLTKNHASGETSNVTASQSLAPVKAPRVIFGAGQPQAAAAKPPFRPAICDNTKLMTMRQAKHSGALDNTSISSMQVEPEIKAAEPYKMGAFGKKKRARQEAARKRARINEEGNQQPMPMQSGPSGTADEHSRRYMLQSAAGNPNTFKLPTKSKGTTQRSVPSNSTKPPVVTVPKTRALTKSTHSSRKDPISGRGVLSDAEIEEAADWTRSKVPLNLDRGLPYAACDSKEHPERGGTWQERINGLFNSNSSVPNATTKDELSDQEDHVQKLPDNSDGGRKRKLAIADLGDDNDDIDVDEIILTMYQVQLYRCVPERESMNNNSSEMDTRWRRVLIGNSSSGVTKVLRRSRSGRVRISIPLDNTHMAIYLDSSNRVEPERDSTGGKTSSLVFKQIRGAERGSLKLVMPASTRPEDWQSMYILKASTVPAAKELWDALKANVPGICGHYEF